MPSGASLPWWWAEGLNARRYRADLSADGWPALASIRTAR